MLAHGGLALDHRCDMQKPRPMRKSPDNLSNAEDPNSSRQRQKVTREGPHTQKMLNMKVDPEMYMKTKDRATDCPTQKATFVPG